jgi:SAM-dependent methyltransferase
VISADLVAIVECPDCRGPLATPDGSAVCEGCGRRFAADQGFLDLRPAATFTEQTRYVEAALHADARHELIAPPVLGSKIRNDMLRRFLAPGAGDRVLDLGCGNGRTLAWNGATGAQLAGIDVSPYFAPEAVARYDLVLGDLRRTPFRSGVFNKAWSLDVFEHLSRAALLEVLREAYRVLADDGVLFVYTHVRKNGWPAAGVRLVNRLARLCERAGLLDLRQERLRKSDHVNPLADHDDLTAVLTAAGFRLERVTYYTPVVGAFVENVLARIAERHLVRGARRPSAASGPAGDTPARTARLTAQRRVRRGGALYRVLLAWSAVMKLDLVLFGRVRSGPFFALLRKMPREGRHPGH